VVAVGGAHQGRVVEGAVSVVVDRLEDDELDAEGGELLNL
jgi:hypothetical protein